VLVGTIHYSDLANLENSIRKVFGIVPTFGIWASDCPSPTFYFDGYTVHLNSKGQWIADNEKGGEKNVSSSLRRTKRWIENQRAMSVVSLAMGKDCGYCDDCE
jgi:hypothetical protein